MADLLECLIQIKGLADTPRRLALRVDAAASLGAGRLDAAIRVARRMAEAEEGYLRCLTQMLEHESPLLSVLPRASGGAWDVARVDAVGTRSDVEGGVDRSWLAQFSARRAATVAVLNGCSAAQLNRAGLDSSGRSLTVADLVAVMLAHDTDCLGAIYPFPFTRAVPPWVP